MRVVFVSANRETLPDAVIPLGILCVMASLPVRHERELCDLCFDDDPLPHLAAHVRDFRPDVVAIGLRNIQNGDYSGYRNNLEYYRQVVATVRSATAAPIVLGGGGFSVMPRQILAHVQADFGISGEGEQAFAQLLDVLEAGSDDFEQVAGLHRMVDGVVVSAAHERPFPRLDDLPRPDRRLVDARYYSDYGIDSVQTKRGCPLRCDYCTYPLIEGRSIRQRDPALVVDELLAMADLGLGAKHVFIVDSVFNLPPTHAKAVCREMIQRGFATPWTCYANPLGFDAELAHLMAEAGCVGAEIGSDSGVDAVLDRLKKGFHVDKIRRIHTLFEAAGLRDCHTFILGTEGESLEDVRHTLDFCRELDPFAAILGVWTDDNEALDTELARRRQGFREEVTGLLAAKAQEFPRWIIPPLAVNFDPRLFRLLRRRGLTGPLWQHLDRLAPRRAAPANAIPLAP